VSKLLVVEDIKKYFSVSRGLLGRRYLIKAVDGVSFTLDRGEILALVGESGSGKTTTGKLVLRLLEPDGGRILFDGLDITRIPYRSIRLLRRRMQMIFQDPYSSLNPRMSVGDAIAEPLIAHGLAGEREAKETAMNMLEKVGLTPPEDFYRRLPSQLSGGQRQRVVIARAMILKPELVVADEPVSMIDASMRASILELLRDFQREHNMALILITHDLAIARLMANKIAVMYLGKIVEYGPAEKILKDPRHPYTAALATSTPSIFLRQKKKIEIRGELADPKNIPKGCRFHPRCPFAREECSKIEPNLEAVGDRLVACHFMLEEGFLEKWLNNVKSK